MTCFKPLKRWVLSPENSNFENLDTQKEIAIVTGNDKTFIEYAGHLITNFQEIPCGKCIGCRLEYAKKWADRCCLEAQQYSFNYMLTLTYDSENLPVTKTEEALDGSIIETGTLVKSDLKKFLDRVRTHWRRVYGFSGIRFYACGEYGDLNSRPHYHILMFNFPVYDLQKMPDSQKGFEQWTSPTLEKLWNKGRISLVNFNWDTAAYCARYVMKKRKGPDAKEYYENRCQIPEFVSMSTHPGIARNFFDKNKDTIYECDEIFLPTDKGIKTVKPSKYFDSLYDLENPEKLFEIKKQRKTNQQEREVMELSRTDLKKQMYKRNKEKNLLSKTKILTRTI